MIDLSISKIVGYINKNIPLLPNKYEIVASFGDKDMWFNCHTISLPSKSIATEEHFTAGPIRKIPYQLINDDFSTVFYVSDDMPENNESYLFMEKLAGMVEGVEYYDDIIGSMNISILDRSGKKTSEMSILECYPTSVSSMDLSYGAEALLEITIGWVCYSFEMKTIKGE